VQYGGTSGKRHRLREAMLWVDPPEYYSGKRSAWDGVHSTGLLLNTGTQPGSWGGRAGRQPCVQAAAH
jgi:hypothetical protein